MYNMVIVLRSVFQEGKKYYPQVFLDMNDSVHINGRF